MNVFDPIILFVILGVFFLGLGVNYAYQIKHTPVNAGYTVLSVVTGFGMIFIGIILILFALSSFGLVAVEAIILLVYTLLIVGALFGGPMFVIQLLKKRKADKSVNTIQEEHDFSKKL